MPKPVTLLPQKIKGFARDFSIDQLPAGFVWNMVDYIPDRHGSKLEGRGAWTYLTDAALDGPVWGGYHAQFTAGSRLLVHAGHDLYDQTGWKNQTGMYPATSVGTLFASTKMNGVMLRDRVYFAQGLGSDRIKYVTYDGTTVSVAQLTAGPQPDVLCVYRDRLVAGGDKSKPQQVIFSKLETNSGPLAGSWDPLSYIDSSRDITGLAPLSSLILVFHNNAIEKIRGTIPPAKNLDTDMSVDLLTGAHGCTDPASIVAWDENVIFANQKGVHVTDGATIRSLTDQGGIGELWQMLFSFRRDDVGICAEICSNKLYVSLLTEYDGTTPIEQRSYLFVCDLASRAWHLFENVEATCMIRSKVQHEEIFWGVDAQNRSAANANRLARLTPTLTSQREADPDNPVAPYADVVDGDGVPVLPRMETGWLEMARIEVEKRMRSIQVSHVTQSQATPTADALKIGAKVTPAPYSAYQDLGNIPCSNRYARRKVRLGRPGYGIQVSVEQIIPTHVSCLYDIGVEAWANDGLKL